MTTAVVSGRVSESVRDRANAHIRAAGLTIGDVVKIVWENIAQTGEVPVPVSPVIAKEGQDPIEVLYSLRMELSEESGDGDWLSTLTKQQLHDEITEGLMEKYGYA